MGVGSATQGVPSCHRREAADHRGQETDPGLVAGTDFEMAEGPLSQQREHACVPRNHLPQLIHPGPGSAEKRADSDRKSTRLNSSHLGISYAVFCLKKN